MVRLPIPGSDSGNWGQILNDYLSQAHNPNGSIKPNIITEGNLAPTVQTKLNTTAGQQGATGPSGPTGSTGPQGPVGASGAPGLQGSTGATGSSGPQGASGASGVQGATGPSGPSGAASMVPGPTGATGPSGPAGTTTWAGITGKPAVIAAGADAAAARTAISAEPAGLSATTKQWVTDTITSSQTTGVVVLEYGAAAPTSPSPGVLYLRKTQDDASGPIVPALSSLGTWAGGSFVSGTAKQLTVPSGAQTGDLLIAAIACANPETITMPSGWTRRITGVAGTSSSYDQLDVWTKTAAAGDSGATVSLTMTGTDSKFVGVILDCVGSFDAASAFSGSTAGSASYATPSFAATTGALPIAFLTDRAAGVIPPNDATASSTWTAPSGWTVSGTHVSGAGQNAGDISLCIAVGASVTGGTVGSATFTSQYTNTRGGAAVVTIAGN